MMIMLYFFILCTLIQSVLCSGQVSTTMATCGPMLDNILRIERAVNNLTWRLDQTNTDVRNILETTKTEQKITKADFKNIKNDLVSTKDALKYTEKKLASAMSKLSQLNIMEVRIEEIANITEKLGANEDVSFQVKQIKHPYIPGINEPLKCDDVTLNKGGGYNPNSGIFTVPKTGTYLCWSNILPVVKAKFYVRLMKEGHRIVESHTGFNQRPGITTITYLMSCRKGNHIWLVLSGSTVGMDGYGRSSYGCYMTYI